MMLGITDLLCFRGFEFRRQWHNQKLASAVLQGHILQSTNLGRQVLVNIPGFGNGGTEIDLLMMTS